MGMGAAQSPYYCEPRNIPYKNTSSGTPPWWVRTLRSASLTALACADAVARTGIPGITAHSPQRPTFRQMVRAHPPSSTRPTRPRSRPPRFRRRPSRCRCRSHSQEAQSCRRSPSPETQSPRRPGAHRYRESAGRHCCHRFRRPCRCFPPRSCSSSLPRRIAPRHRTSRRLRTATRPSRCRSRRRSRHRRGYRSP